MVAGGRESRSAAALARSLSPLSLALALLSTMPGGVFSQGLALRPQMNTTCDSVPYPFVTRSKSSRQGFEVLCGPHKEAMLPIGEIRYQISLISVPESIVVIFAGPISQVCYDRNGKPTPDTGTGAMSLEETPFTFSKRNKLVNIGCNHNLEANFTNPLGDSHPWPFASCMTSCGGGSAIIRGACSGEACCEQPIPDQVTAAQSFTLSFNRTTTNVAGEEYGTCSAAFFLAQDEQVFTFKDADERAIPLGEALVRTGERRMILDWAIGGSTCDQAQGDSLEPLCSDTGLCFDAPRGAGYICKCPDGYQGNPYAGSLPNAWQQNCNSFLLLPETKRCAACSDIDECGDPSRNNCIYSPNCHNIPGSYTCSCPDNKTGDGYKTGGTGCKDAIGDVIEPQILAEAGHDQLYAAAELSVRCLNLKGEERPCMKEVASNLDGLKRSFSVEQNIRRKDELVQKNSEQGRGRLLCETRPISTLQSSEVFSRQAYDADRFTSSQLSSSMDHSSTTGRY
ncbi:hypothetical protein EJB05_39442, partial [Eragrostis curvula]